MGMARVTWLQNLLDIKFLQLQSHKNAFDLLLCKKYQSLEGDMHSDECLVVSFVDDERCRKCSKPTNVLNCTKV